MAQRSYLLLPINADEGFPQAFRLNFLDNAYRVSLYVNALEGDQLWPNDYIFRLPEADAFMVMTVVREDPSGSTFLFRRKLVLDFEYEAAELAFVFRKMNVAKRNLNGIGAFGSEVIGGIAAR
ncbi:MAG: hypothetical protein KDJ97_31560 [Anaerolineae bacterium]|nr:hypothetical protein [Anaerolineae bacterium]